MIKADQYYKDNLIDLALKFSEDKNPRPKWEDGTPAYSQFITQVFETYNIQAGEFPIPTVRETAVFTGIREILWIYQKQSNCLATAREMGINWWDAWDIGDGTIGQRYGATVKDHALMDKLLRGLENDPYGRRHIMDLWQVDDLESSEGLSPCAFQTMWSVRDGLLDMTLTQRSNDYIVAGYINKIQYVALQMMVAEHVGLKPGKFSHLVQNLHIYDRHIDAAARVLERLIEKRKQPDVQPKLIMEKLGRGSFYNYDVSHFSVTNKSHIEKLGIKLPIAV